MDAEFAHGRIADVLLIEDDPGDIRLTSEVLKGHKVLVNLHVVKDGYEGLDYIYQRGRYVSSPRPDLILLDLNIPGKTGLEVLSQIKNDEKMRHIPVVVLTVSSQDHDIIESYKNFANCFITKPLELDNFIKVIHSIEDFWLSIVKLPTKEGI